MDFKRKTLLVIVITLIVIVALAWKIAIPLVNEANSLGSDINDYQGQISSFASYTNYMADLKASYKENEADLDRAESAIVKNSESSKLDFLREVENISDKTSNVLEANLLNEVETRKNVKNKEVKKQPESSYSDFGLNLRVRGTFSTLLNFLVEVENMPYYNNIESVSVSSLADNKFSGLTVDSILKMKVYIKP